MKDNSITTPERLLRLRQVLELVPVGRGTWLKGVKSGRFPASVKQDFAKARATFWRLSDINDLIASFREVKP